MGDLEKFLHNEAIVVPDLVRAAIVHYQFETIHPFNDGNGRIGRLLITLSLVSKGVLAKPSLYLSDFFERNRSAYIDALMRVRTANDLGHWIRFFLSGVLEIANKGRNTFEKILTLRIEMDKVCMEMGKGAPTARRALELLYSKPFVSAKDLETMLGIAKPTAQSLVKGFEKAGVLNEITGQQRYRLFVFGRYLDLFLS